MRSLLQNGYDNSAPQVKGRVKWDQDASFQARSVAVIEAMAARYGRRTALLGFGLLNEPIVSAADLALCDHSSDARPALKPNTILSRGFKTFVPSACE